MALQTQIDDKHASTPADKTAARHAAVSGEFIDFDGERYYVIRNVNDMEPFFVSVISNDDHWLFASSNGGLTAGRVSPATALLPYITVDKIHDSTNHTGPLTLLRVDDGCAQHLWEPFNVLHNGRFETSRQLYKNVLGNKLCFEEVNHDLQLAFRYTWMTSDRYGFVRRCEIENLGGSAARIELLDGLQNILPAGTPRIAQTNSSNLVDAYKWTELDETTGLALFTLYSGITDRAEPCESLKANVVFCLGLDHPAVLISSEQVQAFRSGFDVGTEHHRRGIRGAYLLNSAFELGPRDARSWMIVADIERSQSDVVALRRELAAPEAVAEAIRASVERGSDDLARIMASGDGFQSTAEEGVSVHHYANVLFNILRGGVFFDQYNISAEDLARTIRHFNADVYARNEEMLADLPELVTAPEILSRVRDSGDAQLARLVYEYLPITFGRRHGDPSRPWNQFSIRLRDEHGNRLLSYEGNWRDIFQNWEALAFSFPEFVESMIAKFVNASTIDGYNPYRITKEGIDWEVEDPDDPWSYIGYWGDHQIIYLQKLLELSQQFHPARLGQLLHEPLFSYANVPYRIRPFDALLEDPKSTVDFDDALAERIEARVNEIGADGKLLLDGDGRVYQVTLLEKLLVPLLSKLGNLVIDGGIWMNTQRPEWNDANNALVGHGVSMVTLYYLRRYVRFLQNLLSADDGEVELSHEVVEWLSETAAALSQIAPQLDGNAIDAQQRMATLTALGVASSRYRQKVYAQDGFSSKGPQSVDAINDLLEDALTAIDHSIATNRRSDGLYHAYNLLDVNANGLELDTLYPMLEGQVSALSSGAIEADGAVQVLEALFASDIYRPDQHSFMLYPDRELPGFLQKNKVPADEVATIPLLERMLERGDHRIVSRDAEGTYRFNAEFANADVLHAELDALSNEYGADAEAAREALAALYERVFHHQAFTGRSGTMFGFEGLGCIYWHMVSKLLLTAQENFFAALDSKADAPTLNRLGDLYYRIRAGIGFNKTPGEFGAFPTDPYSHTPKHAGARQPGMTGQVKEEILTRFGELGVRVADGVVRFVPKLLRPREFVAESRAFRYLDVDGNWQEIDVPAGALAFTWCQIPIVYQLSNNGAELTLTLEGGVERRLSSLELPAQESAKIFARSGSIRQIRVAVQLDSLFLE